MSNIKCTTLRFNIDKPLDRQAWEYLHSMDKDEFKSYSHAVAMAVTEYFKRYYRRKDDPYFETREREERFVEQIVNAVENGVEKALPSFLAACFTKMVMPYSAAPTINITNNNDNDVSADDIDMDFVGG
ncbi:hypothetical protein [Ruminococcus albus]|uniref:Adenylate cyclase n=1 Tax=Ruminococcus albus (strain ATCC 27210 / DSM 20455 / JCM 14654 / NCDO 2250 / 7) TaxID=697329 RepID=E6UCW3_RUMA7|nr:hypothetical protein [Ruminococcus albus]ADU22792.1 hypothetical protein Rumal_2309 [Ruminococcus albus 7 = DSM 20455]